MIAKNPKTNEIENKSTYLLQAEIRNVMQN